MRVLTMMMVRKVADKRTWTSKKESQDQLMRMRVTAERLLSKGSPGELRWGWGGR